MAVVRSERRSLAPAAVAILAAITALGLAPGAFAHDEHDWIRKGGYRSPLTNEWCCGKEDCVPIPASQVDPTPAGWHIESTGEVVPYVDTLPSEDGRFWRCHQPNGVRRCFFVPPGRS
ncbi:MAG TPA: hypothetical protein VJ890_12395 [Vineibacter sp.]|nr:hypothetical protein [Vineibacter sp.]